MQHHSNIPPRILPPGTDRIIQSELRQYRIENTKSEHADDIAENGGSTYETYDVQLGPFAYLDYGTCGKISEPLPQNMIIWSTEPKEFVGAESEEVVQVCGRIIEVRDAMKDLGYGHKSSKDFGGYVIQLDKLVDPDALVDELGRVKDKFGNWKQ